MLNFVPIQKCFSKNKFCNKINGFCCRIRLKARFKDQEHKAETEESIFRKPTDKTWILQKNHITIETFIEATNNKINKEIKYVKTAKYSNLSKEEQKSLKDLQERGDIVIVSSDQGRNSSYHGCD